MDQALREGARRIVEDLRLEMDFEQIWYSPPVPFDRDCVASVRKGH